MANDQNQCNFTGNLGGDPDGGATQGGTQVSKFSIGCGWKTKEKSGTEWIRIVAFGRLAEICNQYLKKGSKVRITGSMRTTKWQDKNGADRWTTEIVASELQMLDSKGSGDNQSPQGGYQQPQQAAQYDPNADFDDDIPF